MLLLLLLPATSLISPAAPLRRTALCGRKPTLRGMPPEQIRPSPIAERGWYSREQIKTLRKAAASLIVKKEMAQHWLADAEDEGPNDESVSTVSELLDEHEFVEVRHLAMQDVRRAHGVATALAEAADAAVLQTAGHATVLFRPREGAESSVKLWSNAQRWTMREKPVRDARGKIIVGAKAEDQ